MISVLDVLNNSKKNMFILKSTTHHTHRIAVQCVYIHKIKAKNDSEMDE